MVFAVVEKAGTTVMQDREELDSWSVIINGEVRIDFPGTRLGTKYLRCGHSFGITPTMEKLYHQVRKKSFDEFFFQIPRGKSLLESWVGLPLFSPTESHP